MFFANVNGETRLLALRGTSPLADAPWPVAGGNARNTSAAGDGPLRLLLTEVSRAGTRITFRTRLGRTSYLEFKNSLDEHQWNRITTVIGDGTEQTVLDPERDVGQRYYRVRSQEDKSPAILFVAIFSEPSQTSYRTRVKPQKVAERLVGELKRALWENDPVLVSSYALITLKMIQGRL